MTSHPAISVPYDFSTDEWVLMSTAYGMTAPAGARLFRTPPHPDVKFRHATEQDAERDRKLLQEYIEFVWPKKAESKAAVRKKRESRA